MYTLHNYFQDEGPETACVPKMKETTPNELLEEIREFIGDGHSDFIMDQFEKLEYHTDLEGLTEWMKNPTQPLHIATETYKKWSPLIFELVTSK